MWQERSCSSMNSWLDILEQHFPKFPPPPHPQEEPPTNGNENKPNRQSVASARILLLYCRQPYKNTPRYFEVHSKFFSHYFIIFIYLRQEFSRNRRPCSAEQWLAISDLHRVDQLYMPAALLPRKRLRYYPLNRRLGGCKRCGEQKNILPRPPSPYPGHYNDRQVS